MLNLLILISIIFIIDRSNSFSVTKSKFYDVSSWTKNLNLQQCVIVEVGEGFCTIFLETTKGDHQIYDDQIPFTEYYLGVCSCEELRDWKWCSDDTLKSRAEDCKFNEAKATETTDARVHRRLCDVDGIKKWNHQCSCTDTLGDERLHKVTGFPTCTMDNLPESLCMPRSVCGVYHCEPLSYKGIYSVKCDPKCKDLQPFCERLGPKTTKPRATTSTWTDWSNTKCSSKCGLGYLWNRAKCVSLKDKKPAYDCFGPNPNSCLKQNRSCKLIRSTDTKDNGWIVERRYSRCTSKIGCRSVDSKDTDAHLLLALTTTSKPNLAEWIPKKYHNLDEVIVTTEDPVLNSLTWQMRRRRTHAWDRNKEHHQENYTKYSVFNLRRLLQMEMRSYDATYYADYPYNLETLADDEKKFYKDELENMRNFHQAKKNRTKNDAGSKVTNSADVSDDNDDDDDDDDEEDDDEDDEDIKIEEVADNETDDENEDRHTDISHNETQIGQIVPIDNKTLFAITESGVFHCKPLHICFLTTFNISLYLIFFIFIKI